MPSPFWHRFQEEILGVAARSKYILFLQTSRFREAAGWTQNSCFLTFSHHLTYWNEIVYFQLNVSFVCNTAKSIYIRPKHPATYLFVISPSSLPSLITSSIPSILRVLFQMCNPFSLYLFSWHNLLQNLHMLNMYTHTPHTDVFWYL